MTDCIFCKIVAEKLPCAKLLEDEAALAFLDIGPVVPGHALLIPKRHHETVDQIPPDEAAAVFRHVPALARAVRAATGATGVNVLQNNGRSANQLVPHVHVHLIPRREGDTLRFNWPAGQYAPGELDDMAKRIREGL